MDAVAVEARQRNRFFPEFPLVERLDSPAGWGRPEAGA